MADIEKLIKRKIDQVVIEGYGPDDHFHEAPSDKRGRSRRDDAERGERSARGEKREPRRERIERSRGEPAPRQGGRGAKKDELPGGFDWRKPYEPAQPEPVAATDEAQLGRPHPVSPRRPKRPVAALLGGLGKKT